MTLYQLRELNTVLPCQYRNILTISRIYWAILNQFEGNDTIATISLRKGLSIFTCLAEQFTIPYDWFAEGCFNSGIYILTLLYCSAILCQYESNDTIATIYCYESLSICTCSSKNLTIPVEGLTESSLFGWTIYGFALWIGWAYLSQVQGYNAIATTCEWEVLLVITCYIIRYAIPYIRCIAELSVELSLYILARRSWRYYWAILNQFEGNDTIATISLRKGLSIFTCLAEQFTIPYDWFAEGCFNSGIYILTLLYCSAILCQYESNDTIATIYCYESLSICTCSSKNLTIPVEGLTESSLFGWTIYGFALWIGWAYLSQV